MQINRDGHSSNIQKFLALLSLYTSEFLHYRSEFVLYLIGGTQPLIMMFIWITLNDTGGLSGDYTSSHFICYFLLIYVVRNFNTMWFPWLDQEIREGDFSFKLLRPVHPYLNWLAFFLADTVIRVPLLMPFVVIGLLVTGAYSELSIQHAPLALLALTIGVIIHYFACFLMGISSFWIERAKAFDAVYYTLLLLFGGAIIPIEMFPGTIGTIIHYTPFPYIIGFPVDVAMGNLDASALFDGFVIQASWAAFIFLVTHCLWQRGIKNYTGAGA